MANKTNYGMLTEVSKSLNQFFGDESGRTVSSRTAHGFKEVFNCKNMDDDMAEFIVHGGMLSAGALMNSANENDKGSGTLLTLFLVLLYHAGK